MIAGTVKNGRVREWIDIDYSIFIASSGIGLTKEFLIYSYSKVPDLPANGLRVQVV